MYQGILLTANYLTDLSNKNKRIYLFCHQNSTSIHQTKQWPSRNTHNPEGSFKNLYFS